MVRVGCGRGCGGSVFTRVWGVHRGGGGVKRFGGSGGRVFWRLGLGGGVIFWCVMG